MKNENFDFEDDQEEEIEKPKKKINMELIFFLILGFLLGVVIKTEASKRITTGFDDYKISSLKQSYNFSELQQKVNEQAQEEASQESDSAANNQ